MLSDKIGTLCVLRIIFSITVISLLLLRFLVENRIMFYLGVMGVAIGFGGFLTLFPIYTNQAFGRFRYGSNYGIMYQTYGLQPLPGYS